MSSLLKTLPVREVESDTILSALISNDKLIGNVIESKYQIDKHLGQGGFGKVFTVLDLEENKNT